MTGKQNDRVSIRKILDHASSDQASLQPDNHSLIGDQHRKPPSHARLIVLLILFAIASGLFVYDFRFHRPKADRTIDNILSVFPGNARNDVHLAAKDFKPVDVRIVEDEETKVCYCVERYEFSLFPGLQQGECIECVYDTNDQLVRTFHNETFEIGMLKRGYAVTQREAIVLTPTFGFQLRGGRFHVTEDVADFERQLQTFCHDAILLNRMARDVVNMGRRKQLDPRLLELARDACDLSLELSPDKSMYLFTQAQVAQLQGDLPGAIEIQTKAVKRASPEQKPEFEKYLKFLVAANQN